MYFISRAVDVTVSLCIIVLVISSLFIFFQPIGNSQCSIITKLYFPLVAAVLLLALSNSLQFHVHKSTLTCQIKCVYLIK